MKNRYRVQATFPQLPAAIAEQRTTVTASNWALAVRCAGKVFSERLKRRRITFVDLHVVKLPDNEEQTDKSNAG